jgi:hypothetical protein
MADVMKGVKKVNRKFQDQFPAVAKEAEYERTCNGNISPIATQIPGPHVEANLTSDVN